MRTTSYDFENEDAVFKVLVNHEEQYSLWPADLPVPGGWKETGQKGPKTECDEYIERVWTDMRPKSLRDWMDGKGEEAGEPAVAEDPPPPSETLGTAPSGE
ncbi:MbtH family protein [Actinomadura nitritigenes]|uniref:MbtH family protein n=1 Tax=Actinomadura nitritigenes TaxID=134602 RepID=UPI00369E1CE2